MKPDTANAVIEELKKARSKYPNFNSSHEGHSLIREELDELWDLVRADHSSKPSKHCKDHMRAECIQIAAMAIRFIEDLCE